MIIGLINCGSRRTKDIYAIFEELESVVYELSLKQAGEKKHWDYDGIIISGGPHLFTDSSYAHELIEEFSFIDDIEIPTLGICLGHQAIGLRHGSKVFRGPKRRGTETIQLVARHPLAAGMEAETAFYENHCEGITLPDTFQLIGSSLYYPVEMMVSLSKPLFGVQFHPEGSGEPGKILFRNFIRIISRHRLSRIPYRTVT